MHQENQINSNLGFDQQILNNQINSPQIHVQNNGIILNQNINNQIQSQSDQLNSTLIRVPFHIQSNQKLSHILNQQIIQKIQFKQQSINLSINLKNKIPFNVNLFKKKLVRPIQILKTKKLIHKKTGKSIKIIKKASNIDCLYDYQQLGDFINTMGSQQLYKTKKYGIKQQDILKQIKEHLSYKIHANDQTQNQVESNDKYLPLIQPLFYLKSYNFVPPLCDMLTNKIKPKSQQSNQVYAKSINYEDQIPQLPNVQVPKFIAQSELYRKIIIYMQKRPCWLKNSLYYTLYQDGMKDKFTINDFKNVMKYTAYTYRNGPWKHTFCKYGFDPKKQYKSIIFQSISIKLKQKEVEDYQNQIQQDVYDPTFLQISNKFIRAYQLCDIANQTIRQIVQGKLISKQGQCTKQHGWLNNIQHGKIMKIMKSRIQQTLKNS